MRPAVSMNFTRPVKNGWQAEQDSTWISLRVERVVNVTPQPQETLQSMYSGWILGFMATSGKQTPEDTERRGSGGSFSAPVAAGVPPGSLPGGRPRQGGESRPYRSVSPRTRAAFPWKAPSTSARFQPRARRNAARRG